MGERLAIWTLGGLTVKRGEAAVDGLVSRKAEALLVYLACTRRPQLRYVLANMLWDEGPEPRLMNNLRVLLTDLRRELEPYVTITRETIAFNRTSPHWLDVAELEQGLARIQQEASGTLSPAGLDQLARVLSLYQGEFLQAFYVRGGQGFEEWLVVERERWRLQVLEARRELVEAALVLGQYQQGLEHALRWLELDPLNEAAHRYLMQLYTQTDQESRALDQYERCRQVLDREMGLRPALETVELYEAIKADRLLPAGRRGPAEAPPQPGIPSPPPFLAATVAPEPPYQVFVGRERELATLATALDTARTGVGQLRFVIGGAGRGKTMLVQEFARRVQAADPKLLVVCGHGKAQTGLGDPYLPFRELLEMLTGEVQAKWSCRQISRQQAQRLWAAMPLTIPALVTHAPSLIGGFVAGQDLLDRAARLAPEEAVWFQQLTRLVAAGSGPRLEPLHTFSQYAALLKTIASQQPLLLILEDLHWADPASCSLLFHLSREVDRSPILVVGTYRPEEVVVGRGRETHPLAGMVDEFKRRHGDIWLDLGELTEADGRRFVAAYLDGQPNRLAESFREALFQQTGGHPLFTVELVQDMQERGDLKQDAAGDWVAGETIDWQTLPVKVEGVIGNRLHRLAEAQYTTLTIASVEGEIFTAEVVAGVQGLNEGELLHQLCHELGEQYRLVTPQALERLGPDGQRLSRFRFRHHLFQHYLYQQLDELERTYLHEAVGTTLEAIYGEQAGRVAIQLARHFQQAGLTDRALGYKLQAESRR